MLYLVIFSVANSKSLFVRMSSQIWVLVQMWDMTERLKVPEASLSMYGWPFDSNDGWMLSDILWRKADLCKSLGRCNLSCCVVASTI